MSEKVQLLVLGTGCAKCNQLYAATEQAAKETGLAYELSKVSDLKQIMALQVMVTPALVVKHDSGVDRGNHSVAHDVNRERAVGRIP